MRAKRVEHKRCDRERIACVSELSSLICSGEDGRVSCVCGKEMKLKEEQR